MLAHHHVQAVGPEAARVVLGPKKSEQVDDLIKVIGAITAVDQSGHQQFSLGYGRETRAHYHDGPKEDGTQEGLRQGRKQREHGVDVFLDRTYGFWIRHHRATGRGVQED